MEEYDVFISYRRADIDFARKLGAQFEADGLKVWADWNDIPPGALNFATEITDGIEGAHAMVCCLSDSYMESEYCLGEMAYAVENSKRIVPLVLEKGFPVDPLPDTVKSVNWVYFTPHLNDANDFDSAYVKLKEALFTDWDHAQKQTEINLKAQQWDKGDHRASYLLSGNLIKEAEEWIKRADTTGIEPKPSKLQREYVQKSRQHQRAIRRRLGVGVLVTLVITGLAALAALLWQEAEANLDIAARFSQSANALLLSGENEPAAQELAVSLAMTAAESAGSNPEPAVEQALAQIAYARGVRRYFAADDGQILTLDLSADGTRILSRSLEDVTSLWDIDTGERIAQWGSDIPDADMAWFTPDGQTVLRATPDGDIEVIDAASGDVTATLAGHTGTVTHMSFNESGTRAVSDGGAEAITWDLTTLETFTEILIPAGDDWEVAITPDGNEVYLYASFEPMQVYRASSGKFVQSYSADLGEGSNIALTANGRYLMDANKLIAPNPMPLQIIGPSEGYNLFQLPDYADVMHRNGEYALLSRSEFDEDTFEDRNIVAVWTSSGGERRLSRAQIPTLGRVSSDGNVILTVDEPFVAMGDRSGTQINIIVENLATEETLFSLSRPLIPPFTDIDNTTALTQYPVDLSVDGASLLIAYGSDFAVWDLTPGVQEWYRPATQHDVAVQDSGRVAFSPDGETVYLERQDLAIDAYDVETGDRLTDHYTHNAAGASEGQLRGFSEQTGQFIHLIDYVSLDGSFFDGFPTELALYDIVTGETIIENVPELGELGTLIGLTLDGTGLIYSETDPVAVVVRDIESGDETFRYELFEDVAGVAKASFSPDNRFLVYVIDQEALDTNLFMTTLVVHDLETDTTVARIPQDRSWRADTAPVSFSADGTRMLYPAEDGSSLILRDITTGETLLTLDGHETDVVSTAIAPNLTYAVSGDTSRTTIVWDLNTGSEIRRFSEPSANISEVYVAISPDSRYYASNSDLALTLRRADTFEQLKQWTRDNRPVRDLTAAELDRYGSAG